MKRARSFLLLLTSLAILAPSAVRAEDDAPVVKNSPKPYLALGTIDRLDPRFDKLIPPGAKLERLAEGFDWAEGPVWNRKENFLLFSDIPPNSVMKWDPKKGISLYLKPAGYTGTEERGGEPGSNGLLYDKSGALILCQHGDRRIARLVGKNKFVTLADKYDGKRFNSPNDGVYKSNGDLYFTDPPYGLVGNFDDPAREQEACGVYRLDTGGDVTLLTTEMTRPNGIAFSPDEKTLYVAQSDPAAPIWRAFDVKKDGTLGESRVFFDSTELAKTYTGLPDGLKVDVDGNLFATGPGGVLVFSPDGTHLGTLNTGEATANCGWGEDGTVLYVTADMYLARIQTGTKGLGW